MKSRIWLTALALLLVFSPVAQAQAPMGAPVPGLGGLVSLPFTICGVPTSLGTNNGGSGSSISITTSAAIPVQSVPLVGVLLNTGAGATASSVSDGTNSYTKIKGTGLIGSALELTLWYVPNPAPVASGATITATLSTSVGGDSSLMFAALMKPCPASGPLDVSAVNTATSGSSVSVSSGALAQALETIIGVGDSYNNSTNPAYNGATGFTNVISILNSGCCRFVLDYQQVSAPASVTYTPTWSVTSTRMGAIIAGFK